MAPFFDSTWALSLLWRERDLVSSSMSNLLSNFSDVAVDEFGAVVGVKPQDDEGEAQQQCFEHGNKESLADTLAGGHHFVLGHAVHGIDVVETFNAVLIALMHAIHAQVAGLVVGRWSAPLADGNASPAGSWSTPGVGAGSCCACAGCRGAPPRSLPSARSGPHQTPERRAP